MVYEAANDLVMKLIFRQEQIKWKYKHIENNREEVFLRWEKIFVKDLNGMMKRRKRFLSYIGDVTLIDSQGKQTAELTHLI